MICTIVCMHWHDFFLWKQWRCPNNAQSNVLHQSPAPPIFIFSFFCCIAYVVPRAPHMLYLVFSPLGTDHLLFKSKRPDVFVLHITDSFSNVTTSQDAFGFEYIQIPNIYPFAKLRSHLFLPYRFLPKRRAHPCNAVQVSRLCRLY